MKIASIRTFYLDRPHRSGWIFLKLLTDDGIEGVGECSNYARRGGGILEAKKIAGMAEAHYAVIAPHHAYGSVAGAAAIQVSTCSPNFLIQEGPMKWDGLVAELLKEPIKWEKGYLIPPTKPGLGAELDENALARHAAK